jgi:hypothetical protein
VSPLFNRELVAKLLERDRIGVRRETAEDILAHFSISEFKTGKVIVLGIIPKIRTYKAGERWNLASLMQKLSLSKH